MDNKGAYVTTGENTVVSPQSVVVIATQPDQLSVPEPIYLNFDNFKPIPESFTKCGCLACQCCYCEPNCFGIKWLWKCLFFEFEYYWCKQITDNPNACCLMHLHSLDLVEFANNCKCLFQACCFEAIVGCPLEESYVDSQIDYSNYGRIDENYVYPYSAACCFCCGSIDSVYVKWPQCVSIYTNSACCCCYTSNVCLKPACGDETNPKANLYMNLCRNRHMCIQPNSCCKDQSQVLCFDHRCSCPYSEEVPCMYMFPLTFFMCFVNYRFYGKFLGTLADLQEFAQNSNAQSLRNKQTV